MSDIKDILGVKKAVSVVAAAPAAKPPTASGRTTKRPPGMGRELYGLIGPAGVHTLAPTNKKVTGLKQKRKIISHVAKWKWVPFKNSGRKDGYQLSHWTKYPDSPYDYVFARFNKPPSQLMYTDEEYKSFLQSTQWTREQTDEMMQSMIRFNGRFPVVHDRLSFDKSIEDIKERFYSIQRIILDARAPTQEDKAKLASNPIVSNPYDKEYEVSRKQGAERIYSRTRAQEQQEEQLLYDFHQLEHQERKHKKDVAKYNAQLRKRGLAVPPVAPAGADGAYTPSVTIAAPDTGTTGRARKGGRKNKKGARGANKTVVTGAHVVPVQHSVSAVVDDTEAMSKLGSPRPANRKMGPGTYLRSTKRADARPPNTKLVKQKLINDKLATMGLTYLPMATEKCVDHYGQIRAAISDLITIEKELSRRIHEMSSLEGKCTKAGLVPTDVIARYGAAPKAIDAVPPPPNLARPDGLPPPPPLARPEDVPLAPLKRGAPDSAGPATKKQRR